MSKVIYNLEVINPTGEALRAIRNAIVNTLPSMASATVRISIAVDVLSLTGTQAVSIKEQLDRQLEGYIQQPVSCTMLPEVG